MLPAVTHVQPSAVSRPLASAGARPRSAPPAGDNDWWGRHSIHLGEQNPEGLGLPYSEALASSTFCFALPGDGWSARLEDSVQHGCGAAGPTGRGALHAAGVA